MPGRAGPSARLSSRTLHKTEIRSGGRFVSCPAEAAVELRGGQPDVCRTAVGARQWALAGGKLLHETCHFLRREGVIGPDGGTAGRTGRDPMLNVGLGGRAFVLKAFQYFFKKALGV